MQIKKIAIFGSTGSIGTQALEYIKDKEYFKVEILLANTNSKKLIEQAKTFHPTYICLSSSDFNKEEIEEISKYNIKIINKEESLSLSEIKVDISLMAITGTDCIDYLIRSIKAKNDIALANKESLIVLHSYILDLAKLLNVNIYPVDSEHSSIWKLLDFNFNKKVKKILITASGGSVFNKNINEIENLSIQDILKHPTWSMGNKITVDSATMINKGFEVLEAMLLFNRDINTVDALIQKDSLIHAMIVEEDNSVKVDISKPNMKGPISIALEYPNSTKYINEELDFLNLNLKFDNIDKNKYPIFYLFKEAIKKGPAYTSKLCFANDVLVEKFLNKKISFLEIYKNLEKVFNKEFINNSEIFQNYKSLKNEIKGFLK